jgi:hypothetical protein
MTLYYQNILNSRFISNCCSAPVYEDTDICSECGEHCERIVEDELSYCCDARILYDEFKHEYSCDQCGKVLILTE